MKYYKIIENGIITGYSESEFDTSDKCYVEIGETEYTEAIDNLRRIYDESERINSENESRIAELEKENAELKNELGEVRKQIRQYTA